MVMANMLMPAASLIANAQGGPLDLFGVTERANVANTPASINRISTSLADVALPGQTNLGIGRGIDDIDSLIRARTGPALDILTSGSGEAVRLSQLAQERGTEPLSQFVDQRAFEEQSSLLGLRGEEAQELAISGIPVSQFDKELQRRQQRSLLRGASARGEVGGGATIVAGQDLAGRQQVDTIQRRIAELEPLVAAARGVRSTQAGIDETSATRQAQLQAGLGTQQSNIRFGATAPLIESRLQQAEISGLRGVSRAQQQGQVAAQLAGLAGRFSPQIEQFFSPTAPPAQPQVVDTFIPATSVVSV